MRLYVYVGFLCIAPVASIVWGTATAAYQIEGFRKSDGRQRSIWDAFDTPNVSSWLKATKPNGDWNVQKHENASRADQDYQNYMQSIKLTKRLGFKAMRMSISWPRVMTYWIEKDELKWKRNEEGIRHYRHVLNSYKHASIKVALTMFHWDLPLVIEDFAHGQECGSAWLCHKWIGEVFEAYATLLISEYKEYVSWWITLNEPLTITTNAYESGVHAPGRCSDRTKCWYGNSSTEPYLAAKGQILAHAHAFRVWSKFGRPGVGCGITLNGDWRIPMTNSWKDRRAQRRSLVWQAAIFADPIHKGVWPSSMIERVGSRLPQWTETEIDLVKGSHDGRFYMNSYTTRFVKSDDEMEDCGFSCDAKAATSGYNFETGKPVGTPSSNGWLFNYGPGLGMLMNWYHNRYKHSVKSFVVTENGWGNMTQHDLRDDILDYERCNYYSDYIGNMSKIAYDNNIKVDAYFAWSLMDNYEWADGFTTRFGLTYVDYASQRRTAKYSALWFQKHVTSMTELPTDRKPLHGCHPSVQSSVVV